MTDEKETKAPEVKKLVCPFLPPMVGQNAFRQQTLNYMTCLGEQCQIWDPQVKQCSVAARKLALS